MEFHVGILSIAVDHAESMHSTALHVSVILWNSLVVEKEGKHMAALWMMREEIPHPPPLLVLRSGVWFERVNHVWKLNSIANEEDREIVAYKIPVPFARVEFHRKSSWISQRLWRMTRVHHGGKPDSHRRLHPDLAEHVCVGQVSDIMRDSENTLCGGPASVYHTFWDPFPVEICKLLDQMIVLQQNRTTRTHRQRVLVIRNRSPRICRPIWCIESVPRTIL
mmetsp:Transcript_13876/g.28436  ORF Transcript_13876/g.28436 Transcript_13876/m.28436 type:complete len:222 (+) Transcript_13876:1148-1813(+)